MSRKIKIPAHFYRKLGTRPTQLVSGPDFPWKGLETINQVKNSILGNEARFLDQKILEDGLN